jgi:hypothetical protein
LKEFWSVDVDPTTAALEHEREQATKVKNIQTVELGKYEIETWYFVCVVYVCLCIHVSVCVCVWCGVCVCLFAVCVGVCGVFRCV